MITFILFFIFTLLDVTAQNESDVVWTFKTSGKILSHPILDSNSVYFGSNDSSFYALDMNTGKLQWKFKSTSPIRSKALINNNLIYFKSENTVYALSKRSGEEVWSYEVDAIKGSEQLDYWDYHDGSPVIDGSTIYFGFANGMLNGFDILTGKLTSQFTTIDSAAIRCGIVSDNSVLYFGDWNGKIYARDLNNDKTLWIYETYEKQLYDTFGQINTELLVYKDLLIFGGRNPDLQIINKITGEREWNYLEKDGGWISGDPLVVNDRLYIGGSDNHEMLAFNALTGEKYWDYVFLNNNFSKPLAYNDYLLFTTGDAYTVFGTSLGRGYLYAINRINGSIKNVSLVGGNIYSTPVVKNDLIFLGSEDYYFYAISLESFLNSDTQLNHKGYNSLDILSISPSPFTDSLKIDYKVNFSTEIKVIITDLSENEISNLYKGPQTTGEHSILWYGKDNSGNIADNGYYFIEIKSGEYYKRSFIQKQ